MLQVNVAMHTIVAARIQRCISFLCAAASRGRLPAGGEDSGMEQVLTWLFADGSSSIGEGQDAAAIPQDMSVSSLQVHAGHLSSVPALHAHMLDGLGPCSSSDGYSRVGIESF